MSGAISRGICTTCKKEFAKNQMTRHVGACVRSARDAGRSFHIVVQGRYDGQYWLHLAALPAAKLSDLDRFLRDIWLECCGHMSAFEIDGEQYLSRPLCEGEGRSMTDTLARVLCPGIRFTHVYDFGTSTELELRLAGELPFVPGKQGVKLLARNLARAFNCLACGKPATRLCSQCWFEENACYCDACSEGHECGEEMLLPIVNSPRVGMCGYTG